MFTCCWCERLSVCVSPVLMFFFASTRNRFTGCKLALHRLLVCSPLVIRMPGQGFAVSPPANPTNAPTAPSAHPAHLIMIPHHDAGCSDLSFCETGSSHRPMVKRRTGIWEDCEKTVWPPAGAGGGWPSSDTLSSQSSGPGKGFVVATNDLLCQRAVNKRLGTSKRTQDRADLFQGDPLLVRAFLAPNLPFCPMMSVVSPRIRPSSS